MGRLWPPQLFSCFMKKTLDNLCNTCYGICNDRLERDDHYSCLFGKRQTRNSVSLFLFGWQISEMHYANKYSRLFGWSRLIVR